MTKPRIINLVFNRIGRHVFGAIALAACLLIASVTLAHEPQRSRKKTVNKPAENSLAKLRDEFITATKTYKASLEKLIVLYEKNVTKAEEHVVQSRRLYSEGLISKKQLDDAELAVAAAKAKVEDARRQMATADTQIANTLLEAEADVALSRSGRQKKGSLVRTSSYIRYNGSATWLLSDAWKVQRFFQDTFKRPLPIAVFGQGPIHDRWRLDHRNSLDVSLSPDTVEAQTLMHYLRANGIPFLAFRGAIPGTATGPHIHIGRPSHRY
jgi:hypothetical protein